MTRISGAVTSSPEAPQALVGALRRCLPSAVHAW